MFNSIEVKESYCPYCHGIKSMQFGDVYCSRQHEKSMNDLATGTLFIKSKKLEETGDHISRLSIRCILEGEQHYKVGGNDFLVTPNNFLVVNQGQHYKTSFDAGTEQEMILVAFQPGFAEDLYYSLAHPAHVLLEHPFDTNRQKINFFEKTYDQDPVIRHLFQRLRGLIDLDEQLKKDLDIENIYSALLTRLFEIQHDLGAEINKLNRVKSSTRTELYRRLAIAKDFMEANLGQKISLNDISKAACLSVHHFKREFKLLYGCTPHRYLFIKRMQRAKTLLATRSLNLDEIALISGSENVSSFIRQFRSFTGYTPGHYRKINKP